MYFTPKIYNELITAVDEWCDNNNIKDKALIKYGDINSWNIIYITNINQLFYHKYNFNDNISDWNVSNVKDISNMFYCASSFNQELNNWNVSNVKYMGSMFYNSKSFNQ